MAKSKKVQKVQSRIARVTILGTDVKIVEQKNDFLILADFDRKTESAVMEMISEMLNGRVLKFRETLDKETDLDLAAEIVSHVGA